MNNNSNNNNNNNNNNFGNNGICSVWGKLLYFSSFIGTNLLLRYGCLKDAITQDVITRSSFVSHFLSLTLKKSRKVNIKYLEIARSLSKILKFSKF